MSRENDELKLIVDHRSSKSMDPFIIELDSKKYVHLKLKKQRLMGNQKFEFSLYERIIFILKNKEEGIIC